MDHTMQQTQVKTNTQIEQTQSQLLANLGQQRSIKVNKILDKTHDSRIASATATEFAGASGSIRRRCRESECMDAIIVYTYKTSMRLTKLK